MLRALAGGCLAAAALTLAACGGGEDAGALTADDYRSQLNDACAEVASANRQLPTIMNEENLSIEEAEDLAEESGQKFEDTIADLNPPEELADQHQQLVDSFGTPPPEDDLEAYVAFQKEGAALFDDIGATGCADGIRLSLAALQEANDADPVPAP